MSAARASPHALLASLCVGIAAANLARTRGWSLRSASACSRPWPSRPRTSRPWVIAGVLFLARLVVGQHAARRARPKRPSCARRHGRAHGARRDRAGSPDAVPAARPGSRAPLRVAAVGRARLARAAAGSLAAPGRRARGHHDGSPAEAAEERVRRTHLARAPRRACRPARGSLEADRPPRRARRASPTGCVRGSRRRSRPAFTANAAAWSKASSSATSRRSLRSCATASAPRASTTCSRFRARTWRSSPRARSCSRGCSACRAGSARSARSARSPPTCSPSGPQPSVVRAAIAGALGSVAWLLARQADRWYFLLLGALVLLAWNPYVLLDAGLPALVRGRRVDLPARAALRAGAGGLPAPDEAGCRPCGLDCVRSRDRAGALVPVPRGSAADGAGERARRPRGPAAARARVRRGGGGSLLPTRGSSACVAQRLVRGVSRGVRDGSSAAFRAPRCARAAACSSCSPSQPPAPPMLGGGGTRARRGLPDHRDRSPEGRPRPAPPPQPHRRGRHRAPVALRRRAARTPSRPAMHSGCSPSSAVWSSCQRSSAGRRTT